MKQKWISVLMVVIMVLAYMPAMAFAADDFFSDVKNSDWFCDDVKYVFDEGIMNGTDKGVFSPRKTTTRAMVVTVLYRIDGELPAGTSGTFTDVPEGKWYSAAVEWAAANEIVNGVGNRQFAPDEAITREQMAAILYRYSSFKQYDTSKANDLSRYEDLNQLSSWAETAMKWANAEGLINGVSNTSLDPRGHAIRAQVAAILHRYCEAYPNQKDEDVVDDNPALAQTKETVYAVADPSTEAGQERLEKISQGIADYWIDDNGTGDDRSDDWCNVVVTQSDPICQDIEEGLIESGNTLFFPQSDFFAVDMSLVYQFHDDAFAGWMDYKSSDYEVLHMKYADFSDLLEENETFSFAADSFDKEDPVAFTWTPGSGISDSTALQSDEAGLMEEESNTVEGKGFQPQNLKVEDMIDVDLLSDSKHAGLQLEDIILFDADGEDSTTLDQIILSGQLMMENIEVDSAFHEQLQWSDPLPKQVKLKLRYETNHDLAVSMGGEIADIGDAMEGMRKYAKENFNTQDFDNVRHLKLLGIDLSGVDMSNSIILGAVGVNLFPGSAPKLGIKAIQSESVTYQIIPSVVILFTIDFDGSVNAEIVGEYTYNSYVEKGFNLQKTGYDGGDGTVEQNRGKNNLSLPHDRNLNIYDVNARSSSEPDKSPVSTFTLTANAKAELSVYTSVNAGLMVAGIIPGEVRGSIGPDLSAELNGILTCASDSGFSAEGSVEIRGDLVVKVSAYVMVKAEKKGEELKKVEKEWESEPFSILSLTWKWPSGESGGDNGDQQDPGTGDGGDSSGKVDFGSVNVGDYVTFGCYEQDNDVENGKEPISWKVLDKQDGRILVISKYGLDMKPYNDEKTDLTWEDCSLRSWLNTTFLNTAFTDSEQSAIPTVTVSNPDNMRFGTEGGNDTMDKVFLLSLQEMQEYFNVSDTWTNYDGENMHVAGSPWCIGGSKEAITSPTAYVKACSEYSYSPDYHDEEGNYSCFWWLRSPGYESSDAAIVWNDGGVYAYGWDVDYEYNIVRPAMWVNLAS